MNKFEGPPDIEQPDDDSEDDLSLDEQITLEEEMLEASVSELASNMERISNIENASELPAEELKEISREADSIKEHVLSLKEEGFITPAFALRLAGVAIGAVALFKPELLRFHELTVLNDGNVAIAACLGLIGALSIFNNFVDTSLRHWTEDSKWDFFEFDTEALKQRWGLGSNE